MNTNYQKDLNIFYDAEGSDNSCSVIKTAELGHLITSYQSRRPGTGLRSVYIRVMSATGVLTPPVLIPDITDNTQKDADLAPICKTDDFVAVWASSATGDKKFRIFCRKFSVGSDGKPHPEGESIQISQSNGHYVAPRIIYNKAIEKFFVTWISVQDKAVQMLYLNKDLTEASYQGSLSNKVHNEYYRDSLDVHDSSNLSISLLNAGDKIIAAYNGPDRNKVTILKYTFKAGSMPQEESLPEYEVADMGKFHMAYDDIHSKIKIVFVKKSSDNVFGDTISYFDSKPVKSAPIQLNSSPQRCLQPFIKRTPTSPDRGREFVIGWSSTSHAVFYNIFDGSYSAVSGEDEINSEDRNNTKKPRIIITDNQLAFILEARRFQGQSLRDVGLLSYVTAR